MLGSWLSGNGKLATLSALSPVLGPKTRVSSTKTNLNFCDWNRTITDNPVLSELPRQLFGDAKKFQNLKSMYACAARTQTCRHISTDTYGADTRMHARARTHRG